MNFSLCLLKPMRMKLELLMILESLNENKPQLFS